MKQVPYSFRNMNANAGNIMSNYVNIDANVYHIVAHAYYKQKLRKMSKNPLPLRMRRVWSFLRRQAVPTQGRFHLNLDMQFLRKAGSANLCICEKVLLQQTTYLSRCHRRTKTRRPNNKHYASASRSIKQRMSNMKAAPTHPCNRHITG